MAFVTVAEDATQGSYSQNERARSRKRVYRAISNSHDDTTYHALTASDGTTTVPAIGEVDADDTFLYCTEKSVAYQETGETRYFLVTCTFGTQTDFPGITINNTNAGDTTYYNNPTTRTPTYNFSTSTMEVPAYMTASAFSGGSVVPVTSSAGQVFDPQPTYPVEIQTFSVTRYEAIQGNVMASNIRDYSNHVNSDTGSASFNNVMEVGPNQARLRMSAQGKYEHGAFYWITTYNFDIWKGFPVAPLDDPTNITPSGWQLAILDQGTWFLPGGVGPPQVFVDVNNVPTSGNLNGLGDKGDPLNPKFLRYDVYQQADFDTLNIFPQ